MKTDFRVLFMIALTAVSCNTAEDKNGDNDANAGTDERNPNNEHEWVSSYKFFTQILEDRLQ